MSVESKPQLPAAAQSFEQWNGAMAVLDIGRVNMDPEQKAVGVGDDMPLTSINAFAGIIAPRAASLRRRNSGQAIGHCALF